MTKTIQILFTLCLLSLFPVFAQTPKADSSLPDVGITYQNGPGNNNTQGWEFPYGTKLSVYGSTFRTFELMNSKGGNAAEEGRMIFRIWNTSNSQWTEWRKLIHEGVSSLTINGPIHSNQYVVDENSKITFTKTNSNAIIIRRDNANNLSFTSPSNTSFTFPNNNMVQIRTTNATGIELKSTGSINIYNGREGENLLDLHTDRAWALRQYRSDAFAALQLINYEGGNKDFLITTNGNVGIGTTSPKAKLAVNGDILATEVRVESVVGGPDYVFKEDYPLASLEEIKAYITANKHLPEVPSAKEMEANGIKLGEMNMLLLKKIEELTLLMIEQNQSMKSYQTQLTAQQKEIEQLKKKIQ